MKVTPAPYVDHPRPVSVFEEEKREPGRPFMNEKTEDLDDFDVSRCSNPYIRDHYVKDN